jgi:hypothetical protein
MPKSECVFGAATVTMDTLRQRGVDEKTIADQVKWIFNVGKSAEQAIETTVESVNFGVEAVARRGKRLSDVQEKNDPWYASTKLQMAGEKGKPYERAAFTTNLFHQHAIIKAQSRLTGQVRAWGTKARMFKGSEAFSLPMVSELATRMKLSDSWLRLLGVPLVTIKAAAKGVLHASHLTFGDILGVAVKLGQTDSIVAATLRNADVEANIPFQNVAEAVRAIIEHRDLQKAFTGDDLAELRAEVMDALLNSSGKSADSAIAAAQARNRNWMMSDEGRVIVGDLADQLTSPQFREALLEEDLRQKMMTLAFSRGDGFQMTDQVLNTIMSSPWNGDRIEYLGALLFDNGLQKIFGEDFNVQAALDGSTLAFAEQMLAKSMNSLAPESLAVIRQEFKNIQATRKDARDSKKGGKTTHKAKNKARKATNDEIADAAAKKAKDAVANDQNARAAEPTPEAAEFAETIYNELKYGSVVGGLAKALSKVSDKAFMSGKGKSLLVGTEHRRLENAAIVSQGMVKMREAFGGDIKKANQVFNYIKANLGKTEESFKAMVAGAPQADRQLIIDMVSYLDNLFGVGEHNMLMQQGIFVDELRKQLKMVGLFDEADNLTGVVHADDVLEYWRQFDPGEDGDILQIMGKFYTAQQLSMIPASMADSLARHFSHVAEGLNYQDALKAGWRPLDETSSFGKYTQYGKTPWLFPPDMLPKIKEMEAYVDYDRSFGSAKMQNIINKMDAVTGVMKSSLTIWRPGHHVVSAVGNAFMNVLAGVRPWDYGTAMKMLVAKGDVTDVDVPALNELLRANAAPGYKLKEEALDSVPVSLTINGKVVKQAISLADIQKGADAIAGVPISPRRVRDTAITDDVEAPYRRSALKDNPLSKSVAAVDHQLARVSAVRDNLARYALFVKELQTGGPYRSIEDAFLAAGQKVHEFHPTVGTLTAPERKYARRLFYFYTWQKQAFFKLMEYAANHPAAVTVPSKLQFALASAQGLDPESFGDPYSATGLWAAYNENSVYGPQWDDDVWGAMGVKPALPQLDVIDSYLSPIKFKPEDGLWGNIGNLASDSAMSILVNQASPVFKIPAELATGGRIGGVGGEITDVPQYLLDQTGIGTLSRVSGWTPWGQRSDVDLTPYGEVNRDRQWWNWLLGAKVTYYESPAAQKAARQEMIDYWQKTMKSGKFAPQPTIAEVENNG